MSLRTRLFLLLVALATLLAVGEWWLVHSISRDLQKEIEETAATVSQKVVQVFTFRQDGTAPPTLVKPDFEEKTEPERAGPEAGQQVGHEVDLEVGHQVIRQEVRVFDQRDPGDSEGERQRLKVVTETGPDGKPRIRFLGPDDPTPEGSSAIPLGKLMTEDVRWVQNPSSPHGLVIPPVPIPTEGAEKIVDRLAGRVLAGTLVLLGLGLGLAALVAHRVTAPLGELVAAAERLGRGDLGTRVPARASGEVGRALVAFNAMSDRLRELDADARELRARQHLSELGEVGRGFAHSLRNPLNALGLAVDQLAREAPAADPHESRELAGRARRQIRRIDDALRAFLALGTDGGPAAAAAVDLRAVAQDVALELAQSRPEGKEGVRVEIAAETPVTVRGVEAELRAALQALMVNAVEASPPGGTVVVRLMESGDEGARFEIDDRGPGLPEEVRRKLFTPHVTTKSAGAGMGLYLAHRIATSRYGGTLDLSDLPGGGGTRATIELHGRTGERSEGTRHG